jgi:putative membrane protein
MKGLENILNGFFIGVSCAVPGVSGGTIAFLTGIYEQFIDALSNISDIKSDKFKKRLLLLTEVGVGIVLGIFAGFKVFAVFFEAQEEILRFFFLGLILFSIPGILNKKLKKVESKDIVFGLLGLVIIWIVGLQNKSLNMLPDLSNIFYIIKLFLVSFISAGTIILPGLSASFLLLILGEYGNIAKFIAETNFFGIFIAIFGALTGIVFLSKVMDSFFKRYREETISAVVGIIIGSTMRIMPSPITMGNLFFDILFFVAGGFLVLKLSVIKN